MSLPRIFGDISPGMSDNYHLHLTKQLSETQRDALIHPRPLSQGVEKFANSDLLPCRPGCSPSRFCMYLLTEGLRPGGYPLSGPLAHSRCSMSIC